MMNKRHANRWTPDSIIAAMTRFADEEGELPTADRWKTAGWWPSYNAVVRHFGSWGEAIRQAELGTGLRGYWSVNAEGRRPGHEARTIAKWQRYVSTRTVSGVTEAQQRALLDPELAPLVIGQIIDDRCVRHVLPQVVRTTREKAVYELDFETAIEEGFERWLIPVLDFRREIDSYADEEAT